ncbi:hypothetical protein Tco_0305195 [Tanacetum coccineum]
MPRKSFDTLAGNLHDVMVETLLVMVDKHIKEQVMKQVRLTSSEMIKFSVVAERGIFTLNLEHKLECNCHDILLNVDASYSKQQYQLYLAMKSDPQLQQQDIAIWLALQMKFERNTVPQTACRTLAVRPRDQEPFYHFSLDKFFRGTSASTSGKSRAQTDDFDFWTDSYASDDDEIPTKQVSHDIMKEVSLTIDEAKLRKMADEMLRQRCTSGDEHQYHIDQMKEFLKDCQRDPEAPALSLINQDLLYLKKGNYGPEKIVLSLHKFPAIIFNDDDIEERTSKWVNKCVKKFNPYARCEIIVRRANDCIVSIIEPDYKNLNKNDIEDIYLLIMNGKKVNLTAPTITFPKIEEHDMFSIIYEPVHGIIYKNSKKEKRVMRHTEIHKFCDATLNRVLEGLKSYNNDVKYGYIQKDLTKDETEYLKLFEEDIEE